MRATRAIAILASFLLAASVAAAAAPVHSTLSGKCVETDTLDTNGALKSATIRCVASGKCACAETPVVDYSVTANEPGTGAPGHETGTITATGPGGRLTFELTGTHSAVGGGTGKWRLVKVGGFEGVHLRRSGTYTTNVRTLKQLPQSMDTTVLVTTSLSCWEC